MKATSVYQEPTPARMLVRFALVIGSLLLMAQLAVLLKPNPSNFVALIGLACIPALSVPVVEFVQQARVRRLRKAQEATSEKEMERENLRSEITQAIEEVSERNAQVAAKAAQEAADHAAQQVVNRISDQLASSEQPIERLNQRLNALREAAQQLAETEITNPIQKSLFEAPDYSQHLREWRLTSNPLRDITAYPFEAPHQRDFSAYVNYIFAVTFFAGYERMLADMAKNPNIDPTTVETMRESLVRRRKELESFGETAREREREKK